MPVTTPAVMRLASMRAACVPASGGIYTVLLEENKNGIHDNVYTERTTYSNGYQKTVVEGSHVIKTKYVSEAADWQVEDPDVEVAAHVRAYASPELLVREDAVLCGCQWFEEVFRQCDEKIAIRWLGGDGDEPLGDLLGIVLGDSRDHHTLHPTLHGASLLAFATACLRRHHR